jgi:hypothetical protein
MIEEHLQRAMACLAMRKFEAAREAALRVLGIEPEHALAHLIVGESCLRMRNYKAGREQAARLIAIAPDWCWGYWLLAWCWLEDKSNLFGQSKCVKHATSAARQALECSPDDPTIHYLAASVALRQGDVSGALRFTEQGLAIAPESQPLCRLRGQSLMILGRQTDAQVSLEQSLRISPDDAFTHRLLAEVFYEQRNYDAALSHIGEAMRLEPESSRGRDQYLEITQTQYRIFRGLTWIYRATRWWRSWSIAWVVAVLVLGVSLNFWVEAKLRDHWSGNVALAGWALAIVAPWITLAIPIATTSLWLIAGRDPVRSSLTNQERWNRLFPAVAILFAPLAIACSIATSSTTPIEYYTTAIVMAQIQAATVVFTSRRTQWLSYAAAGIYAVLVPTLLIHQLAGTIDIAIPALVLNTIAIVFTTVFRIALHASRR